MFLKRVNGKCQIKAVDVSGFFIWGIVLGFFCSASAEQTTPKPNIIIIVADDMGWGDPAYNGNEIIKTPALDRMAQQGIRFDRFYAACCVCAPTRASIMTGQNGARMGISHWGSSHVNQNDILVSEILKDLGYATGHFGKWHLGLLDKEGKTDFVAGPRTPEKDFSPPWVNGFDVCFSTENVAPTWDPMKLPAGKKSRVGRRYETGLWGNNYWDEKGQMIPHNDNLIGDDSRIIMDRAIPFISKQVADSNPFFAYICFHTPHTPTITGGKYLEMYKAHEGRHHYGAITAMDAQIGRLRDVLQELGQEENTLIWFCSDNGAMYHLEKMGLYGGYGSNKPFRDWKSTVYEGGIRVPSVLVYPAMFKEPAVVEMGCVTSDILPTLANILEIPGIERSLPQDGMDILPALKGDMTVRDKAIGFAYGRQAAWMTHQYKLITKPSGNETVCELYDLLHDPSEENNIGPKHPEKVESMLNDLRAWIQSCNESCGQRYKHLPVPMIHENGGKN